MKDFVMHVNKDISALQTRVGFFDHLHRGKYAIVGDYPSMSSMVFDTRSPDVHLYTKNVRKEEKNHYHIDASQAHYTTQNIHTSTNNHQEHYFKKESSVQKHLNLKQLFSEQNVFSEKHEPKPQEQFNQRLLEKFFTFSSTIESSFSSKLLTNNHKSQTLKENKLVLERLLETGENSVAFVHPKEEKSISTEDIKHLEQSISQRVEERIVIETQREKEKILTVEERTLLIREEKKSADKIYSMVMKRWDKERSRKGHLYD